MRFEVLTVVLLKIQVFWDVTLMLLGVLHDILKHCDPSKCWELHPVTQHHIPEDWNLQDVTDCMEQSLP